MKKLFTLALAVCALVSVEAQKKVGYFGLNKTTMASTALIAYDPILVLLEADPNFVVTRNFLTTVDNTVVIDYSLYDIIIVQESFGGGNGILTPSGALGLAKITKPFLYNKNYALQTGRVFTTGTAGAGVEAYSYYLKVDPANQSNDLFKAITFTDNSVALFKKYASDTGTTTDVQFSGSGTNTSKSINYNKSTVLSNTGTLLGVPKDLIPANSADVPVLCVNDIPSGTMIGSETTQARSILIGLNFGAMCGDYGGNMTEAGLTLIRNAAYVLAGLPVPTTAAVLPTTALSKVKADNGLVLAVEGGIKVNAATTSKVSIYSIDGKMIASKQISGTETIACQKGVYMVRVNNSAVKVMVSK